MLLNLEKVAILLALTILPSSPAQSAQRILVLEVVEENWDTLPGCLSRHRLGPKKGEPDFWRKYGEKRKLEGKDFCGYYEDDLTRVYDWGRRYSADEVLAQPKARAMAGDLVGVWYRIQYKGRFRGGEIDHWISTQTIPVSITPETFSLIRDRRELLRARDPALGLTDDGLFYSQYASLRSPADFEIVSVDGSGKVEINLGRQMFALNPGESRLLLDTTTHKTSDELRVPRDRPMREFRTRTTIINHGFGQLQ